MIKIYKTKIFFVLKKNLNLMNIFAFFKIYFD